MGANWAAPERPSAGLPMAKPEDTGFSSEGLARIRRAMKRYIDSRSVPGVVTFIARHGSVAHFEAQGQMYAELGAPMASDTIFRIASMTKPITAVAALILYEEGRFRLGQPISDFLPAFRNPKVGVPGGGTVPAAREVTFHDCMTHTAGFSARAYSEIMGRAGSLLYGTPYYVSERGASAHSASNADPARQTMADWVESLARVPLSFQPGASWEYHPGYDVLGVLVEVISGQRLDRFFEERIFEPLGMNDTGFYLTEEKLPRFAAAYAVDVLNGNRFKLVDRPETSMLVRGPQTLFSGGAGLLSTAADYARFAQMLLNRGILDGVRILSPETVDLMTTNHTDSFNVYLAGPGYGYGLGVWVLTDPVAASALGSVGQYGWGGAFCTWYFADPGEDLFALLFTQVRGYALNPDFTIRSEFEALVYEALVDG